MSLYQFLEGHAHLFLDGARVVHVSADAVQLGAVVTLTPE